MTPHELAAEILAQATDGDTVTAAVMGGRCVKQPIGCGQLIPVDRKKMAYDWPSEAYREEWKRTGLCASCQDQSEQELTIVRGTD